MNIEDSLHVASHTIPNYELILNAHKGLGQEYDYVVVLLTHTVANSTLQEI